jgi:CRISPR-associated endonuclease/helicase Cas3
MTFTEFFKAIWGEDKEPFPWQQELVELALQGQWPSSVGLPTAAGKTALIDIAVYALAVGAPSAARRIFFVVDRRVIVDEAADRARVLCNRLAEASPQSSLGKLAENLRKLSRNEPPLMSATLRGGIPTDDSWTDSPLQPIIVCSTVDQVGSSLLFRAYGASEYARPIRAALVAYDALVILDEAHTSQPFAETLLWISRYLGWAKQPFGLPFTVVELSATPRNGQGFRESAKDLLNPILKRRWEAEKRTKLVLEENGLEGEDDSSRVVAGLVREARALRDVRGARIIGVIANRVKTARRVYEELSSDGGSESILLTGRSRPWDRDQLWQRWKSRIGIGRLIPEQTIFVVATQCIEVGADIDFDGLVTELASIDALEQRFGRLARDGSETARYAAIVAEKQQIAKTYFDPIYGEALSAVWRWLNEHVQKKQRTENITGPKKARTKRITEEFVPMGVLVLRRALRETSDRQSLTMPIRSAPILLASHIDLLCQTAPEASLSPEPAVFLHGPETGPPDVQVVWREDLERTQDPGVWEDIVAICPPNAAEAISLPIWAVREWLSGATALGLTDIEGVVEESRSRAASKRPVLEWQGPDENRVLSTPEAIRPGTTIVVPAGYGGCDEWGWNPDYTEEVTDIGDAVKLQAGRTTLRLHPRLAERWNYSALAQHIREADSTGDAQAALEAFEPNVEDWVKEAVTQLLQRQPKLVENPSDDGETWAAVIGKGIFAQESTLASYTVEVPLDKHLAGCAALAQDFAANLPESIQKTVIRAAELHDIGKADPRFQAWLRGGNPIKLHELLAKSGRSGQNRRAIARARELARYPKGGRHELMSVALLVSHEKEFQELDFDLLLHLVASHHGRCRPFAPVVHDNESLLVRYESWVSSSDHRLERASSGISERFWRLTRRYGWYGLAFLETLVRLSDQRQSEQEQENRLGVAAYA